MMMSAASQPGHLHVGLAFAGDQAVIVVPGKDNPVYHGIILAKAILQAVIPGVLNVP
jgi:hypothetical protein